jgi:hypothetical protein
MMKLWWFLIGLGVVLVVVLVRFLLQRQKEQRAQREGVAVYATVVSMAMETFLGKPSPVMKITLWIQEPGKDRREITLRSRVAAGQNIAPGAMLPVVVDPKNPKQVYPAGPEAQKRVVLTGSREQRRQMKRQLS